MRLRGETERQDLAELCAHHRRETEGSIAYDCSGSKKVGTVESALGAKIAKIPNKLVPEYQRYLLTLRFSRIIKRTWQALAVLYELT